MVCRAVELRDSGCGGIRQCGGVDEQHYHAEMYEVYLVVQGRSTAVVDGQTVILEPGNVLIVEPGEMHTFTESTPDYYHFVVHAPVVKGDKHYPR